MGTTVVPVRDRAASAKRQRLSLASLLGFVGLARGPLREQHAQDEGEKGVHGERMRCSPQVRGWAMLSAMERRLGSSTVHS
jgi:hypothetical protein